LFFVLTMLFAWSGAAASNAKRVVLLHSFGQDFKPWSEYGRSIRSELQRQSPWQLDITDHSLVTARSSNEDPEAPFVAYLRALFAEEAPDLIVSVGAPAAAFVQRHRPQLFPITPMVLTAVDERRVQFSALSENDAVVAVRIDYLGAIENILAVLPDTKDVMVVVGTSPVEQFWMEEIGKAVQPLTNRVSFTWTNNLSFDEVLKHAAALPPRSAIFWELMIVDAAGVVHEGTTALARLHAVSNAPIFSYDEAFFGREIVGGPLLAVLDSSRQTAAVAIRILGGEKASDIKIPSITFSKPKFDWREMQRWGIGENRLPPGSEILFREETAWQRYRWQIASTLLALLVQSALIAWLLAERFGRRRAETHSRTLSLEVIHLNRAAEAGVLSASFAHDLGQPLVSIALNAQRAEDLLKERPELGKVKEAVVDIMHANHHAAEIVKQFGKLLKRRSDRDIQEADLTAVIADALSILSTEANRRHVVLLAEGIRRPLLVGADHRPAELIGDEIADHRRAKSSGVGRGYRWAAGLPPLEHQLATRAAVRLPSPANHDLAMAIGQRTVLGGVGGQLMQNDRHRLSGFCGKVDMRALNERTLVPRAEGQLTADELTEVDALPMAPAQESVRIRQRIDAIVERVYELVRRSAALPGALRDRGDAGEHILHAMVQLGDQQALVLLGFSAFGHINVNPRHALGATGMVVGNEASRFNPPDLSAGPDKAKFIDDLASPFLERSNMFGVQTLHIVSVHARKPLLSR
jgi:signal transduction histidine kinase